MGVQKISVHKWCGGTVDFDRNYGALGGYRCNRCWDVIDIIDARSLIESVDCICEDKPDNGIFITLKISEETIAALDATLERLKNPPMTITINNDEDKAIVKRK